VKQEDNRRIRRPGFAIEHTDTVRVDVVVRGEGDRNFAHKLMLAFSTAFLIMATSPEPGSGGSSTAWPHLPPEAFAPASMGRHNAGSLAPYRLHRSRQTLRTAEYPGCGRQTNADLRAESK
jgi:hypothetical protein